MENRRHGAAKASKPFRNDRSKKESGEKPYRQGNYKSRYDQGSASGGGYRKKKYYGSKGENRFQSKKSFTPKKKGNHPARKREHVPQIVSDMQVTDGKHRGTYLKSSDSPKVRPTARRVREVMFRILYRQVKAGRFLDLCAGAGTIGIEAISRGALIGTFVERSAKMCTFIKKNLETCSIKDGHGEVFEMEVIPFLKKMQKRRRFWDVVYYDPPYDTDYDGVLEFFKKGVAIRPGGILVIEHHAEMFFPENIGVMKRWKVVVEGDTAISFYDRKS